MLKRMVMNNFIGYRSLQVLDFEEGANFLVGANSTGKTACFELIRKCLSLKNNPEVSYIPDRNRSAFVICEFELNEYVSGRLEESMLITESAEVLYSFYIIKGEPTRTLFKLVFIKSRHKDFIAMDALPVHETGVDFDQIVSYTLKENSETEQIILRCVKKIHDGINVKIDTWVDTVLVRHLVEVCSMENSLHAKQEVISPCEQILRDVEEAVVITFPVHAPLQWNKSPYMGSREGGFQRYRSMSESMEIIQKLLGNTDIDENESNNMFNVIASPHDYQFKKVTRQKDTEIVVDQGKGDSQNIPLRTIPEGILEARNVSLLLAHTKYKTICLEEPGRGMDPPMVQKMRDLLLRKQTGKTIIVVSHKPEMTNMWTLDRLFMCRLKHCDGITCLTVLKMNSGMLNVYQEDQFKSMLYASCVLFVEGTTDAIIVRAIFDEIIYSDSMDVFSADRFGKLRHTIAGIQIVEIGGNTSYNPYRDIAETIGVPYWFLLNKDAAFMVETEYEIEGSKENKTRMIVLKTVKDIVHMLKMKTSMETTDQKKLVYDLFSKPAKAVENIPVKGVLKPDKSALQMDVIYTSKQNWKEEIIYQNTQNGERKAKTVKDALLLNLPPCQNDIRKLLEEMVLPVESWVAKQNSNIIFNLDEGTENDIETYNNKNIFIWHSGNLEDLILKHSLQMNDKEMIEYLWNIFFCNNTRKMKHPVKEAILVMSRTNLQDLAQCLLKNNDVLRFLTFLIKE